MPAVTRSKPAMSLSTVVLPDPDGPSIEKNSPSAMSRSTPSTARTSPKCLLRPRSEMAGASCVVPVIGVLFAGLGPIWPAREVNVNDPSTKGWRVTLACDSLGCMRSIWKGSISFGLVNVPVKVYSATESHDVSLHQVHEKDGGRIRYQRKCEVCGKVVAYEDITKAYDDGTNTVVLTEEELKSLPAESNHEIDVVEFVPADQIDPIRLDKAYYLEPDARALKPYTLLRRALEETDRSAVVQFALRQKTRLAVLRVKDKALVLQTMLWDDEVREADVRRARRGAPHQPEGARHGLAARRLPRRRLRREPVHRRLPGAAAHARRGEARAG